MASHSLLEYAIFLSHDTSECFISDNTANVVTNNYNRITDYTKSGKGSLAFISWWYMYHIKTCIRLKHINCNAPHLPTRLYELPSGKIINPVDITTYDILSYTWDNNNKLQYIMNTCKERSNTKAIHKLFEERRCIHENSHNVNNNNKWLCWVDALCIYQNDHEDKINEIQKMGQYYKNARMCHVWLHDTDKYLLQDCLTSIDIAALMYTALISNKGITGLNKHFHIIKNIESDRWFKRVWTLQEAVLPCIVIVHMKDGMILLDELLETISLSHSIHDINGNKHNYQSDWRRIKSLRFFSIEACVQNVSQVILELLIPVAKIRTTHLQNIIKYCMYICDSTISPYFCKDINVQDIIQTILQRDSTIKADKIYGLLGLRSDIKMVPNYSLSLKDIWFKFMIQIICKNDISPLLFFSPEAHPVIQMNGDIPYEYGWRPTIRCEFVDNSIILRKSKRVDIKRVLETGCAVQLNQVLTMPHILGFGKNWEQLPKMSREEIETTFGILDTAEKLFISSTKISTYLTKKYKISPQIGDKIKGCIIKIAKQAISDSSEVYIIKDTMRSACWPGFLSHIIVDEDIVAVMVAENEVDEAVAIICSQKGKRVGMCVINKIAFCDAKDEDVVLDCNF